MKLGYLMPDVFGFAVAKQLELGAVCSKDGSVGANPVTGHGSVFEEIAQILLTVAKILGEHLSLLIEPFQLFPCALTLRQACLIPGKFLALLVYRARLGE